ncbi:P-type DNA transfer protein VirB5 [Acidovorax facilis]|uniref:P-type DNA transfer protein VirB5 n=1 Tax=Acidovorax facilis TaxID=12917 RepID=UPI003D64A810
MRKATSIIFAAVISISFSGPTHAFVTNIATETTQIASWAAQYIQMLREYQQLVEEYKSLNGIRGMANLVNDPISRKYLPKEFQTAVTNGYGNWQSLLQIINSESRLTPEERFEKFKRQIAIDEAMTSEAYKQASQRFEAIQTLLDKVNNAPDAKDIADLAARIQAEQVMLQNEQNKMSMLVRMQEIQTRRSQQMSTDNAIRRLSTQPITRW